MFRQLKQKDDMKRRTFLLASVAGISALATGIALYRSTDLDLEYTTALPLDEDQQQVLLALLPALLNGTLSDQPDKRQQQLKQVLENMAEAIRWLPSSSREELQQLLSTLSNRFGKLLLTGGMTQWPSMSLSQRLHMLDDWRYHYLSLLQQAYFGLKELSLASWYSQPDTWPQLGYIKPNLTGHV